MSKKNEEKNEKENVYCPKCNEEAMCFPDHTYATVGEGWECVNETCERYSQNVVPSQAYIDHMEELANEHEDVDLYCRECSEELVDVPGDLVEDGGDILACQNSDCEFFVLDKLKTPTKQPYQKRVLTFDVHSTDVELITIH